MSHADYEVVIIGAGITGLVLAAYLAKLSLRVAVVADTLPENLGIVSLSDGSAPISGQSESLDGWVSVITPSSQKVLEEIGVWQQLPLQAIGYFDQIHVWDNQQSIPLRLNKDLGSVLGFVVQNALLKHALFQLVQHQTSLITWLSPARLNALSIQSGQATLTLSNQSCITTQLVVGADGQKSTVRVLSDISCPSYDYQQTAVVAAVRHTFSHHNIARQVFLKTGPLAFLPLADPYSCALVWTTTVSEATALKTLSPTDFCLQLQLAFGLSLGELQTVGVRQLWPLSRHHSKTYVKSHIALIGDAAHAIHPLAGQGANLGIADAAYLAKVIREKYQNHRAIGAYHNLKSYERGRKWQNQIMIGGIEAIRYLFKPSNTGMHAIRALGLARLQRCVWMQQGLIRLAV